VWLHSFIILINREEPKGECLAPLDSSGGKA
jgi:hypothetical protein